MRINEMFNGAPKAPTNNQPQKMYVEDSQPHLVVAYPGRFQPFHLGHRDVFASLQNKFGRDHVYITTSNKTEAGRSPFNFSDKLKFMIASGVPVDRIIENTSPYKLPSQFDYENSIYLVVCGEQDAYRLRPGELKENGQPSYYQNFESLDKCKTADNHAYVVIAKERQKLVTIGGKQYDASHGTECRNLWNKIRKNSKQRGEFLLQVFGRNDPELGHIMDKIDLSEAAGEVALPVDTISPIHGGTVKENAEPSDSDLFGDRSTVITDKVNEVIDLFTKNIRDTLDSALSDIGASSVNDISPDAHETDVEFIVERVGLLKFMAALRRAFDISKEDGLNLLRSGWSELDPVVNFRGQNIHIPVSEICDEFASQLREKHNVDVTGLLWNTGLSESTEPDDEELFGKEEPIIFRLTRLLKNKQPVHIRLLNGKVWQVLEVHPEPSSKYYAQIVFGKLGPNGSRHGSMSMTKMMDQRKLSLTHTNDGYMLTQNSADKWFVSDLSETPEPSDEELFGKGEHPLVRVKELLDKFKSVYIQLNGERYPIFSIYVDERLPKRHSDSVTYLDNWKHKDIDVNPYEWTVIPFPSVENAYILKNITVTESTDPSDEELFGKRYEDRIADGMEDYAKTIEDELATAHPSWADHEHTIKKKKEARASRQLGDTFRKGGVEAGKGMINALMKMPNYLWLYDLHDFMKDHRGINLHDLYGDARRLEESEPSDADLFGDDYEVYNDPTDWQHAMGAQRQRHDIVRRDFLKDYTTPNGDICLYLRNDEDGVVGAFYAPQTSNVRVGTFLKYGSAKNIQDYIDKDPHCPFNKLSEDAAGVGVVSNSKDPRYVMATMGDQNDVTADTVPRQLRAYGLTGRKPPKLGRERR